MTPSPARKSNVDCLLRKIAKHVKEARMANSGGRNIQSHVRDIYSLLGSIRLEIVDVTEIQATIENLDEMSGAAS